MLPATFDGAAPPVRPQTVARDGGRTTVRAVRLTAPLRLDGALDEELDRTLTPVSDFIQAEPSPGAPATEKTEVWVLYDDTNIYVAARLHESQPDRMVVNEMRRDSDSLTQNENFQFAFDTFNDGRNSFAMTFNPLGGRRDGQYANENAYNGDFNPVWDVQVRRSATGWTAEAAVPFKSLRFKPGAGQVWGIQFRRINRWKNEVSFLTETPAQMGNNGAQRVSRYAALVGLEMPGGSRPLDVKPYVTSNVTTDRTATPQRRNDPSGDIGLDAKYAVSQNLTADLTVNTDFAQVEADEQQVNLTRFSLFFPEKRDFFLENSGVFDFGGATRNSNNDSETPVLFYSRRIGLERGREIPLDVGGRLTGRVGRYSVGVMNMSTGDEEAFGVPGNTFTVARVRRDILRRSSFGALYTRRSTALNGGGGAELFGVDSRLAFFSALSFNAYYAKTATPGAGDDDTSYRLQAYQDGDRYGAQIERIGIGRDFDPQLGFMRREDFHKTRGMLRFSPRPQHRFTAVRKFTYQISAELFTNPDHQFESRERRTEFTALFRSSEQLELNLIEYRERLAAPFSISRGVIVPVGDYHYAYLEANFLVGQQRRASGTWGVEAGHIYDGTRTTFKYTGARVKVSQQLAFEPGFNINRVRLPYGNFTSQVISTRTTYTVTPLMFVSGLVQYNASTNSLSSNVRLRWEYRPGSELFVVYNDGRDTTGDRFATLQSRTLVFKINRLFRF